MKLSGPLESQRLSLLLEMAISRETQMWKVHVPKIQTNQDAGISPAQRDEVIQWLAKLKCQFRLYPETLALAVSLLDRFLAAVKARPKYLNCIAISCFFLAAKTIEEDERIPVLKVLARDSFCGCSPAEIRRMEKIILDKLNWDLHTATPLDFLHIFHAVASSTRPQLLAALRKVSPSQHVALLGKQLLRCLACHQLLQFKGSMLALAILSLEVEKLIPDWLSLIIGLLQKAQMDSSQLIHCRELVAQHLSPPQPSSVYIYSPFKHSLAPCHAGAFQLHRSSALGPESTDSSPPEVPTHGSAALCQRRLAPSRCRQATAKRKVEEMEVDDFYDGIKRLYNEENAPEGVALDGKASSACSTNVAWPGGSVSPCPPLQPVSVM
ncbi:cyclin-I isoform X1 [Varanus komodoensis]|uniref:Cyclin-I n=1 Tax=Varanus komodoensis TaxID=61221 RepID=A0A8D2KYB0_VARKO|nr:cyclin-I isoform X1 [Varanus komodoensis]XP_044285400.1 cyclin-I isoform X1 [Varanus komodoensis]